MIKKHRTIARYDNFRFGGVYGNLRDSPFTHNYNDESFEPPPPATGFLLQEDGFYLLQEDGYRIIITS